MYVMKGPHFVLWI